MISIWSTRQFLLSSAHLFLVPEKSSSCETGIYMCVYEYISQFNIYNTYSHTYKWNIYNRMISIIIQNGNFIEFMYQLWNGICLWILIWLPVSELYYFDMLLSNNTLIHEIDKKYVSRASGYSLLLRVKSKYHAQHIGF